LGEARDREVEIVIASFNTADRLACPKVLEVPGVEAREPTGQRLCVGIGYTEDHADVRVHDGVGHGGVPMQLPELLVGEDESHAVFAGACEDLLSVTRQHREIWSQLFDRPELARLLDEKADARRTSPTLEEELFISLLILHLNSAYRAIAQGLLLKPDGLKRDIQFFFGLPIPRRIWEEARWLQDQDFARFVDKCLERK
jgi:hypothetical protein